VLPLILVSLRSGREICASRLTMRRYETIRDLREQRALIRLDLHQLNQKRGQLDFHFEVQHGDEIDRLIEVLHQTTKTLVSMGVHAN